YPIDFADVRGQEFAKRTMVVAASGAHNCLKLWTNNPGTQAVQGDYPRALAIHRCWVSVQAPAFGPRSATGLRRHGGNTPRLPVGSGIPGPPSHPPCRAGAQGFSGTWHPALPGTGTNALPGTSPLQEAAHWLFR